METALRYELIQAIPELTDQIYPTNAPEGVEKPYLVYARITTRKTKLLDGYTDKQALSYMLSVMSTRYADMVRIRKEVENLLLSLPGTEIGENRIHIEDINVNNITEQYEHELKVNRGIIDITIYF